ncbi:hypothetical protein AABB02_33500 [Streptomyces rimosus]|uniref:hypothetical protein n=1 Tax=Streptomyces rimosus TaxID=1927 RepID=UPI0031D18B05
MAEQDHRSGRRLRKIFVASIVGLPLVGLIGFCWWLDRNWEGEPYPVADPAATTHRLDGHAQAVYDVLGLPHAELDTTWPGNGTTAKSYSCRRRGLRYWNAGLQDATPPSESHVVKVSSDWALKGVTRAQALRALQRARQELMRRGWEVTAYDDSRPEPQLRLKSAQTGDSVSIEAFPGDRLQVVSYADCARYPAGTSLDTWGIPVLPLPKAPHQLRG